MTAKDRSKHPRYKQLAETLIADVRAGKIKVGATLPGELELVDRFGVSRHTVREALRLWRLVRAMSRQGRDALFRVACCPALLDEPAQACNAFLSVAADARMDLRLRRRAAELARLVDPIAL